MQAKPVVESTEMNGLPLMSAESPTPAESHSPEQPSDEPGEGESESSAFEPVASGDPSSVHIAWHCEIDEAIDAWLVAKFAQIAKLAGEQPSAVSLAIVADAEMAELHEQYKQVPGTTDVLTFDLREHENDPLEGDVVLCIDEAIRQAKARGHDVSHELLLYAVHGLLHLTGYDDQDEADAAAMHAREDELLQLIGLSPVYASRG